MERVIDCPNCFDFDKCFEDVQEDLVVIFVLTVVI